MTPLSVSLYLPLLYLSHPLSHSLYLPSSLSLFVLCVLMCTRVCFGSKQSCIIEWRLVTDEGSIRLASLTVRLLNGTGGCLKWAAPLPSVPNTGPTLGTGVGSLVPQPAVSQQIKQSINRETTHSPSHLSFHPFFSFNVQDETLFLHLSY